MNKLLLTITGALASLVALPAGALYEQARWITLDNGMDVIVIENHRAPAVTPVSPTRSGRWMNSPAPTASPTCSNT